MQRMPESSIEWTMNARKTKGLVLTSLLVISFLIFSTEMVGRKRQPGMQQLLKTERQNEKLNRTISESTRRSSISRKCLLIIGRVDKHGLASSQTDTQTWWIKQITTI